VRAGGVAGAWPGALPVRQAASAAAKGSGAAAAEEPAPAKKVPKKKKEDPADALLMEGLHVGGKKKK